MMGPVFYWGDTSRDTAAAYLCGLLDYYGVNFRYRRSDEPTDRLPRERCALYIISDYPAERFSAEALDDLAREVNNGVGLLMIGGWESFHGCDGGYHKTALTDVLPVVVSDHDDRTNCPQPCLLTPMGDHPITADLPFQETPPGIGGFNRFTVKPGAEELLQGVRFSVAHSWDGFHFQEQERVPVLVTGTYGPGRTAALATDVAPHWVGGLVDWGRERVFAGEGETAVEVGADYASFIRNLIGWCGRF